MADELLLSTAYFPPVEYFSLLSRHKVVMIEKWENYHKQTWRNRCRIFGANGPLMLIVPVLRGSFHKTPVRDLEIDYSHRWQQMHLRAIKSAYAAAPYFEFYFDAVSNVIGRRFRFLLDLNTEALSVIANAAGLETEIKFTESFADEGSIANDYRYMISPKRSSVIENYSPRPYIQVFSGKFDFVPGLSIIDMLFNNGPGTGALLLGSLASKM